jgi:hypothetical protein
MSATKTVICIAAGIALLFMIAFGQPGKPSQGREQERAGDDEPIVIVGGSLSVTAKPGTEWRQAAAGSPNWVHYESGSPSTRYVTAIDIAYIDPKSDPAHEYPAYARQEFPSHPQVTITIAEVTVQTGPKGQGLTYMSPKDKPTKPQPHVLRHSNDNFGFASLSINGTQYNCGKRSRCTLIVHYFSVPGGRK